MVHFASSFFFFFYYKSLDGSKGRYLTRARKDPQPLREFPGGITYRTTNEVFTLVSGIWTHGLVGYEPNLNQLRPPLLAHFASSFCFISFPKAKCLFARIYFRIYCMKCCNWLISFDFSLFPDFFSSMISAVSPILHIFAFSYEILSSNLTLLLLKLF